MSYPDQDCTIVWPVLPRSVLYTFVSSPPLSITASSHSLLGPVHLFQYIGLIEYDNLHYTTKYRLGARSHLSAFAAKPEGHQHAPISVQTDDETLTALNYLVGYCSIRTHRGLTMSPMDFPDGNYPYRGAGQQNQQQQQQQQRRRRQEQQQEPEEEQEQQQHRAHPSIPYQHYPVQSQQPEDFCTRAHHPEYTDYSSIAPDHEDFEECSEISTRPRLTKEQVDVLEAQFQAHPKPNSNTKRHLALQTKLTLPRVAVSVYTTFAAHRLTNTSLELVPESTSKSQTDEEARRVRNDTRRWYC